jgi:hypothetical protein
VGQAGSIHGRLIALVATGLLLLFSAECYAGAYSDPAVGCSFEVPDDWTALPQSDLDDLMQRITTPGAAPPFLFIAAFQPRIHTTPFEFPYVLIQTMRNARRVDGVSEEDVRAIAAQITGASAEEFHKAVSLDLTDFVSDDADSSGATYFTDPPGFRLNINQRTASGTVREVIYGLIGRDRVVSMVMYSLDNNFSGIDGDFPQIMSSFRLTPAEQAPLRDSFMIRIFEKASMGAVALGIGGLLCLLFFRGRADSFPDR